MTTAPPLTPADAAQRIAAGELIAFPTETVYGLGADACNDAAVAQIFAAKGRPREHPLIVHVLDESALAHFAKEIPDFALRLLRAFWPGPLTVIVPRKSGVARVCAGGQDSIGLRCPAHPLARELLLHCAHLGVLGIAAPSANRFGRLSPTCAAHVQDEFGAQIKVLDGGDCDVGIESTIIDCSRGQPIVLRPGILSAAQIQAALGMPLHSSTPHPDSPLAATLAPAPRASGTLASHYAPKATLRLMDAASIQTAIHLLGEQAKNIALYTRTPIHCPSAQIILARMPANAAQAAHQLFATLRRLDAQGVDLIWVEQPAPEPEWDGIRDRLLRAAASR